VAKPLVGPKATSKKLKCRITEQDNDNY